MGERSRRRRARRAFLVPLFVSLLRAAEALLCALRPGAALALARVLGEAFRVSGATRAIVRRNLELACGREPTGEELREFERRYYRHLALLVVEFLRQPLLGREALARHFGLEGIARVRSLYDEGQGVILVAGHAGVWELAGHVGGLIGLELTSVAKLSGQPELDAWTTRIREAGGQRIRDARGSLWAMKKALDRGEAVGINVDQEARTGRVFAPFFGIPAATSETPATLHLRTGAPIVVVTAHRVGPFRYTLDVFDVIRHAPGADRAADVLAVTARINRAMEVALRRHPEQWLWSHRRWRRRPEGERRPFARVTDDPPLSLRGARDSG